LVILPLFTVSITAASRDSQNAASFPFLSNKARCCKPLVQAKIDAMGLVEVSLPAYQSRKCLVTVP